MSMKTITFNEFCEKECDGLYNPRFPDSSQCYGYIRLKEMVINKIEPASLKETKRWETTPTHEELMAVPHPKYLNFLHNNLRIHIIENWEYIKNMAIEQPSI